MHQIIETIGYVLNTVPYTAPFAFLGTFFGAPAALPRFLQKTLPIGFEKLSLPMSSRSISCSLRGSTSRRFCTEVEAKAVSDPVMDLGFMAHRV